MYLSLYLKAHRAEYYDRLTAIRTGGNWEGWLKFFLRGVFEVSQSATTTARAILALRDQHQRLLTDRLGGRAARGVRMLDVLFRQPRLTVKFAEQQLDVTFATANKLIDDLASLGILAETTGARRNRPFRYKPYLALFDNLSLATVQRPTAEK